MTSNLKKKRTGMTFKFQSYWETQNPRFEKWRIATRKMKENDHEEEAVNTKRKKGGEKGEGDRRKKRKKEHAKTEKEGGKSQGRVQARQRPQTLMLLPEPLSGSPRDRSVHVQACDFTALACSAPKRDHEKKRARGNACTRRERCLSLGFNMSMCCHSSVPLERERSQSPPLSECRFLLIAASFSSQRSLFVTNGDCSSHASWSISNSTWDSGSVDVAPCCQNKKLFEMTG